MLFASPESQLHCWHCPSQVLPWHTFDKVLLRVMLLQTAYTKHIAKIKRKVCNLELWSFHAYLPSVCSTTCHPPWPPSRLSHSATNAAPPTLLWVPLRHVKRRLLHSPSLTSRAAVLSCAKPLARICDMITGCVPTWPRKSPSYAKAKLWLRNWCGILRICWI